MQTQCSAEQLEFSCVERRRVVAAFDGGEVTSDGGALLLKRTDEAIGLLDRLAGCFIDRRSPLCIEHTVRTLSEAVPLKELHAKIGQQALEIDF